MSPITLTILKLDQVEEWWVVLCYKHNTCFWHVNTRNCNGGSLSMDALKPPAYMSSWRDHEKRDCNLRLISQTQEEYSTLSKPQLCRIISAESTEAFGAYLTAQLVLIGASAGNHTHTNKSMCYNSITGITLNCPNRPQSDHKKGIDHFGHWFSLCRCVLFVCSSCLANNLALTVI